MDHYYDLVNTLVSRTLFSVTLLQTCYISLLHTFATASYHQSNSINIDNYVVTYVVQFSVYLNEILIYIHMYIYYRKIKRWWRDWTELKENDK